MKTIKLTKTIISCLALISISFIPSIYAQTQAPFKGVPRTIPGLIQAVEFDTGGEGIAYHDVSPQNEGDIWMSYRTSEGVDIFWSNDCGNKKVGLFKHGEWMEYTVNLEPGTYDITIRVAAETAGKQLKAYIDNSLIATFDVPGTGSYEIYQNYTIKNISLPGGTSKVLKLENVNNDFTFDWIKFERSGVKIQTPYKGVPWAIPGAIQAINFDEGGEGIAYHDVTPINEGYCWRYESVDIITGEASSVGWFTEGEWLEYTINASLGTYDISIRLAAKTTGGQLKAYLDDSLIVTFDILPNAGSEYATYQTHTVKDIAIYGGSSKILKMENVNGDFEFEWIRFEPTGIVKPQEPYYGQTRTIPGLIEAEDFDSGGEGIAYHDLTPYNEGNWRLRMDENVDIELTQSDNGYFVGWFRNGEWIEYTVNVDSGVYDISIRVAADTTGKQLKAYLGDRLITTFDIPNTGSLDTFQTYTVKNVVLQGGSGKILKLENVNNDFNINWIQFERSEEDKTQTPIGGTPRTIPGIIEAEDFDEGGEGIAYHDVTHENEGWWRTEESVDIKAYNCGYDNFIKAVGWFKKGEWMEYTVNVDSGNYDISIRVGTAKSGKKLKAYLDEKLITTFNIPKTGIDTKVGNFDYYNFQTYTVKNVHISGGDAKLLRLENVNSDFDIDWIQFERVGTIKTQSTYQGNYIPGTIEAEYFDNGGEGVAYHDVSPTNEGGCGFRANESVDVRLFNYMYKLGQISWVGKFKHGEWMEYTVYVDSGTYDISIMVGAENTGKQLKAYLNNSLIATFNIPKTGSFTTWQIVTVKNIVLSGDTSILRLENVNGDFNINWIKFERSGVVKTQLPYGQIPWKIPGIIEAEDFDRGGEGIAYHDVTPDGGWWIRTQEGVDIMRKNDYDYLFFVGWFKHGEWMEYTVDVDSGAYDISISIAAITTGRQLKAYLNDSLVATFDIPNTGSYKKYQTYTVNNIVLSGGTSKILRLENVNNDFDFDWIKFEPVKALPVRTIPGTIQAEDFNPGGEGVAYHDVTPANDIGWYRPSEGVDIGHSGSEIDPDVWIGWFKHGEWMKYTVNVESGIYDISIRVAAAKSGRQLKAYLDDILITTFDIPKTGSYKNYQTYTVNNIVLSGGADKRLRLENVNDDFDFDWIKFTRTGNNSAQNDEQKTKATEGAEKAELKSGSLQGSAEIMKSKAASLSQNAPNPFTQTTRIEYYLPESVQNAVLDVYNIYGLHIKSIPVVKGNGIITINGSEIQPGVYIYKLFADGQEIDSKRMIVIK